jgi:predicted Zn-dependent peptidase
MRNDAIYGGVYQVTSRPEKNDSGIFGVYAIENAGKAAPQIREMAKQFHESLKGKEIIVDRGTAEEEEVATADDAAADHNDPVPF